MRDRRKLKKISEDDDCGGKRERLFIVIVTETKKERASRKIRKIT